MLEDEYRERGLYTPPHDRTVSMRDFDPTTGDWPEVSPEQMAEHRRRGNQMSQSWAKEYSLTEEDRPDWAKEYDRPYDSNQPYAPYNRTPGSSNDRPYEPDVDKTRLRGYGPTRLCDDSHAISK